MRVKELWSAYHRVLNKYPLRTQMVQTGIIMGLGDVISQGIIAKKSEIDSSSVIRFSAIGVVCVAPSVRAWYIFLERVVGSKVNTRTTLAKVSMDQLLFSPIFTGTLISIINACQGKTREEVISELQNNYVDVILNGWKIWPMAQLINFYFVPFLVRPLFVSMVALFWNSYLAWKVN